MGLLSARQSAFLLGVLLAGIVALLLSPTGPVSLAGDDPEPAQLTVSSLEQLETGCRDDVATYASSRSGNGSFTRVSFLETGNETANVSVRTERTSPTGAALRTFRVYVESDGEPRTNSSCTLGVQYRVELAYDRGGPRGFLSGDDGTRVLWLENGEYAGCSSITEGSLDSECHRFVRDDPVERTWANATVGR